MSNGDLHAREREDLALHVEREYIGHVRLVVRIERSRIRRRRIAECGTRIVWLREVRRRAR